MTEEAIKKIVPYVGQLIELANTFLEKATYKDDDDLGFMLLLFLSKQLDHMHSIGKLCPTRDTVIIARAMVEGFWHLRWAAEDPISRPLKWRHYVVVADWKLLQQKKQNEENVDDEDKKGVLERITKYGDQFLKQSGEKLLGDKQRDNLQPNHYHNNFLCGTSFKEILNELEEQYPFLKDQYENLYVAYSDWAHWGTSGLGNAIKTESNAIKYSNECYGLSASSISCGFECLFRTLQLANGHFQGGVEEDLDTLVNTYLKDMGML